ncbi:hypothetical protein [Parvularcula maris]|uniref:Glutamine amidotransferase domain-containing protein n=1 Tax=Parvularcula maris TaxID=2965077 RepID=A0A9X2RKC3_9PROT|nr:hypothetical protein [Parvularcula maris]MCQ8185628.1 hypothetical protein [Parvularcula maris]
MTTDLTPLLPLPVIAVIGGLFLIASLLRLRVGPAGMLLRLLTGVFLIAFLLGPQQVQRETERLADQVLLLVDRSGSMGLGERTSGAEAEAERLTALLEAQGSEVIRNDLGSSDRSDLEEGFAAGLGSVERDRLGAVVLLSDGQLSGAEAVSRFELPAPVHTVLVPAGDPETDRRIAWTQVPSFALVGKEISLRFRVESSEAVADLPVTLRVDGSDVLTRRVPTGEETTLTIPADRPGQRIVQLLVPEARGELTGRNNIVSAPVNVIRDRLRVLLISGQPHAGERVWRNVLKSDPAVDLVHFTILKPGNKIAYAGPDELNLIPFPSRELFLEKLSEFNVVVFDRYTYRSVITSFELAEVARYVEEGGAVLIAAGPELALPGSLSRQPNLSYILPATPNGPPSTESFVPKRTDVGARHPITAPLLGEEEWGRWLRLMPAQVRAGDVLLEGGGRPLLVTSRFGEGRVAMMLSDHLWLWARGFDGGGPHREFLRRLVHWLMAEPELEEEALLATLSAEGVLSVERRTLSGEAGTATLQLPGEEASALPLEPAGPGRFTAAVENVEADSATVEAVTETGQLLTAAAIRLGGASPEFDSVLMTSEAGQVLAEATGGGVFTAGEASVRSLPSSRDRFAGQRWLGVKERRAELVLSERRAPLLPRPFWLLLAGGTLLLAWLVESGRALQLLRFLSPGASTFERA